MFLDNYKLLVDNPIRGFNFYLNGWPNIETEHINMNHFLKVTKKRKLTTVSSFQSHNDQNKLIISYTLHHNNTFI